jgi:peptide-methionine (S)-S-oxide reductase
LHELGVAQVRAARARLRKKTMNRIAGPIAALLVLCAGAACAAETANALPAPAVDSRLDQSRATETAVLAGGCFWGMQGVFQHVKGVRQVVAGYAGGSAATAQYETVGTGTTGHAESVRIVYDPRVVSYGQLLRVYFSVMDPTTLDYQGPDTGSQYRSEIFAADPAQRRIAEAYIGQLANSFARPIVTRVGELHDFYPAETYHQDYLIHHPDQPYIAINDLPNIENMHRLYPDLYRQQAVTVARR